MNLFLIGFRCTGKTSVGQILARRLGWPLVDTDRIIVDMIGSDIARMVEESGWAFFRKQERRALEAVCAADRQVVATGGGIVLDDRNIQIMKAAGRIVWLTASPETVEARMHADDATALNRPPLAGPGAIEAVASTLAERRPLYQKAADFSVDTDGETIAAVCARIEALLNGQ